MLKYSLLFCALFALAISGCGSQNAMELRSAEFAYTPEKLGAELAKRLKDASASRSRSQADSDRGADIRELESDRGGDGDRPDPASVEAIITDAVVKIKGIQAAGTEDAADQVMTIINAESEITESVKKEFESGVRAALDTK